MNTIIVGHYYRPIQAKDKLYKVKSFNSTTVELVPLDKTYFSYVEIERNHFLKTFITAR